MSVTTGLHRSLQHDPHAIAVIDGEWEISFKQLATRVARLAGGLRATGVGRGDRVGILATNRAAYVEYALACPWLGAVATPINNRWSFDEMSFQVDETDMKVLLVDEDRIPVARRLRDNSDSLSALIGIDRGEQSSDVLDYAEFLAASEPVDDVRQSPDELALLLYTGGTTGRPKGVMLTGGQILCSALGSAAMMGSLSRAERALHVAPLFHLAAYAGLLQCVYFGSTHVLMGEFTVAKLVNTIAEKQVTATTLVPTMVRMMLDHVESSGADISSLHRLSYGASPMSDTLLRRLMHLLPDLALRQAYGMTELSPVATVLTDEDHHDAAHPERLRSVGRAATHNEVRIVDQDDRDVPVGEVGEIVVRGPNVMTGYWRDDAATEHALRGGWMHTGDAGYMDRHGYVYLVDRIKDMIVSGGENVYSAEVESIIQQHGTIASCAVVGVPDDYWGERVHAVLVLKPDANVTADELREFVSESIARYKAPRSIDIVDELPLSPVGKILKRELRARYRS